MYEFLFTCRGTLIKYPKCSKTIHVYILVWEEVGVFGWVPSSVDGIHLCYQISRDGAYPGWLGYCRYRSPAEWHIRVWDRHRAADASSLTLALHSCLSLLAMTYTPVLTSVILDEVTINKCQWSWNISCCMPSVSSNRIKSNLIYSSKWAENGSGTSFVLDDRQSPSLQATLSPRPCFLGRSFAASRSIQVSPWDLGAHKQRLWYERAGPAIILSLGCSVSTYRNVFLIHGLPQYHRFHLCNKESRCENDKKVIPL